MGDITIEESNYRAFALMLANMLMLIASISIVVYGIVKDERVYWLPGSMALFVFLIGCIASVVKAVKVKILLVIKVDGIIDNSSISGMGFISFKDIKEFRIVDRYKGKVIAVIPKNIDVFLSKLSIVKRKQVKRNINMDMPLVSINAYMVKDMDPEDILSLLQKRLIDYNRLYE